METNPFSTNSWIPTLAKSLFHSCLIAASIPACVINSCAQEATENGIGFAGAYAPSRIWQAPTDPKALHKLHQFQDLKFGFFYCWGTQTLLETVDQSWSLCPEQYDWNRKPTAYANLDVLAYKKLYESLITQFNPVDFSPDSVADLAQAAGTKYLVFCTKHHDGFCFWDTKTTNYKITSNTCPYSKNPNANVTQRLFDAFRKKGFWIGAYFSKSDWNTPSYWAPQFGAPTSRNPNYDVKANPNLWNEFKNFTTSQIRELMTDYGAIDILWLDGGQVQAKSGQDIEMPKIAQMARELQPGLLVVDRTAGGGYEDYLTPEGTHSMPKSYRPEVWEACMTLGRHWGWTKDSNYHDAPTIIRYLTQAVARNGNLLLDVGPDSHGNLDPKAVQVLHQVGTWLKRNGEAIYHSRPVAPYEFKNAYFSKKADGSLYAMIHAPTDQKQTLENVSLPASLFSESNRQVVILGDENTPLTPILSPDNQSISFVIPEKHRSPLQGVLVLKIQNTTKSPIQ